MGHVHHVLLYSISSFVTTFQHIVRQRTRGPSLVLLSAAARSQSVQQEDGVAPISPHESTSQSAHGASSTSSLDIGTHVASSENACMMPPSCSMHHTILLMQRGPWAPPAPLDHHAFARHPTCGMPHSAGHVHANMTQVTSLTRRVLHVQVLHHVPNALVSPSVFFLSCITYPFECMRPIVTSTYLPRRQADRSGHLVRVRSVGAVVAVPVPFLTVFSCT